MIPGQPLFIGFVIQNTSQNISKIWKRFKHIIFINLKLWKINLFEIVDPIWKRRAPQNDEDPFKIISNILNMAPISTWKHEMKIW